MKNSINIGELRNFDYKLKHIGGINGIFISAESEFQDGARKVAEYKILELALYKILIELYNVIRHSL